jgi:hypothetical protein
VRKSVTAVAIGVALACAAGAGAASRWIITSTQQIKPSVVSQLRGRNGRNGPSGHQGPQGPAGPAGPAGVVPALVTVDSPQITIPAGQTSYNVLPTGFEATCPSGDSVIGTGFNAGIGKADFVIAYGTFVGGFIENSTPIPIQAHLQAVCGQVAGGSSGAYAVHRFSQLAAYQADLRRAALAP